MIAGPAKQRSCWVCIQAAWLLGSHQVAVFTVEQARKALGGALSDRLNIFMTVVYESPPKGLLFQLDFVNFGIFNAAAHEFQAG